MVKVRAEVSEEAGWREIDSFVGSHAAATRWFEGLLAKHRAAAPEMRILLEVPPWRVKPGAARARG